MKINPIKVITLLQATFQVMQIPETSVNRYEVELAENFKNILLLEILSFQNFQTFYLNPYSIG